MVTRYSVFLTETKMPMRQWYRIYGHLVRLVPEDQDFYLCT